MTTTQTTAAAPNWVRCPACSTLLYQRRLARDSEVCHECGHHRRLGARARVAQLTDPASFRELPWDLPADDPLGFTDQLPYRERLARARQATGHAEGITIGTATIGGHPVALGVMDFGFLGGSMGVAVGAAVAGVAEAAVARRLPLVLVTASGGARMQEGVLSLLQMVRTSHAIAGLRESGLLSVCVLTDPTFGGVTASFASLGDVLIAESGALVGFAGPRVIRETVGEQLPPGFQTAESLLAHGLVDRVERRDQLRPVLTRLFSIWSARRGPDGPRPEPGTWRAARGSRRDAWEVVQAARDAARPTALDHLALAFDDVVELHGDRAGSDDPAVVGALATLGGRTVVVVAHQKGHDTRELVARNFGMPQPAGYRKAIRFLDLAERLGVPVVTLVDTPGAYPGVAAELGGQSIAIAETVVRAAGLRVPVVCVVTGEGGSGGALALATGDRLLALENAFLSVISPEGCAAILWRSAARAQEAARALRLTAAELHDMGVVDDIVAEPAGGAQADPPRASALLRGALLETLTELCDQDVDVLLRARADRMRRAGTPTAGAS